MYGGQKWPNGGTAAVANPGGFAPPVGYQYQPTRPPPMGAYAPAYGANVDPYGFQPIFGGHPTQQIQQMYQPSAAPQMMAMPVPTMPGGGAQQSSRRPAQAAPNQQQQQQQLMQQQLMQQQQMQQQQQYSPPASPGDQQQQQGGGEGGTPNPEKFKTELCRKFALTGFCRYGDMCQFAHGAHELRALVRHPLYKTSPCKSFESTGSCRYGARCRFIHNENAHELATLARGVPALNLQVTEPSWEEAQAATLDAVQHMVVSTGLSPQLVAASLRHQSPQLAAVVLPQLPSSEIAMSLDAKPPKASMATSPLQKAAPAARNGVQGDQASTTSRVLSSPPAVSASTGEIRSISSLIKLNNGSSPPQQQQHQQNGASPTHGQRSPSQLQHAQPQQMTQRVGSSVKLVIDEDVFPPANLDARRLPVAGSTSWVNLPDAAAQQQTKVQKQRSQMEPSSSFTEQQQRSHAMKHSYSQPALGGDPWRAFSSSDFTSSASAPRRPPGTGGSIASLPVYPPTSPMSLNNEGLDKSGVSPTNGFVNSTSSPNLARFSSSGPSPAELQSSNFKKAASFANHMWFESNASSDDLAGLGDWSNMARARSVEGRLDIFRNMSDPDLAKMAANASSSAQRTPRLPSFEEKLGDVGLALSDDEDHATDEGVDRSGHDTEEDEGFTVGKF